MPKGSRSPHHHLTKSDWEHHLNMIGPVPNYIQHLANRLGCGTYSVRNQLQKHGLYKDTRGSDPIPKPPRETLVDYYTTQNMTLLDISKRCGVSNVTVRKWMKEYNIPVLSHSACITTKVIPKIVQFNRTKYGQDHFFATPEGKQKISKTFMQRYGVPYHPIESTSQAEQEVLQFLITLISDFHKVHIHGIELDMYSPSLQLAVEYCGIYWHSEKYKSKYLHATKHQICQKNGIRLITLFEDEWLTRKQAVQGFLRAICHRTTHRIYARQCIIQQHERSHLPSITLLKDSHIQGIPNLTTTHHFFSLYHQDLCVAVMAIGAHPRSKALALTRYVVRPEYQIIGGAQKLFAHVRSTYPTDPIWSWSDNRWSNGGLYQRLGFELIRDLPIDYGYVDGPIRRSKQSCQKKVLGCQDGQTEHERAKELGMHRIWDCGKKSWCHNPT